MRAGVARGNGVVVGMVRLRQASRSESLKRSCTRSQFEWIDDLPFAAAAAVAAVDDCTWLCLLREPFRRLDLDRPMAPCRRRASQTRGQLH